MYIDASGHVFPCCWTGGIISKYTDPVDPNMRIMRDRLNQSTEDLLNDITYPKLHGSNIVDVLKNSQWAEKLPKHWTGQKAFVCVKNCASNLKLLVE